MRNFLIGMHGRYQKEKYERDFMRGYYGIEACLFPDEDELKLLLEAAEKDDFKIGIHFPLLKKQYIYRDPLFMSLDKSISKEAYESFEKGVKHARDIGAEYILTHFPKPFVMDRNLNWSDWRCMEHERVYKEEYPLSIFNEKLAEMFDRLSEMSQKYDMQIVLEHDAMVKSMYTTDILEYMFSKYSNLKICLDTGRLHLFNKVDPEFNVTDFVTTMSKYTYLMHLWNEKAGCNSQRGHYPCLPELKPSEGWADIEGILKAAAGINKNILYKFEHDSTLISDKQLQQCYSWIDVIVNKASAK
ncbi:MAG: sugar phosphate isomerase/epimerase family protein [Bacillota bacterium]